MAIERPAVGSDEWFYWLIDQINGGEGTALTDEAIAAIVDRENSHTRASIVALYMAGDTNVLRDAKAYADTVQIAAVNAAKTYSDTADAAALAEATRRIASAVSGVSVPLQNYADTKDAGVRSAAFAQAAQEGANAKAAANTYTDQKTAGIGKAITDGDAATLTEAKRYADTVGGGASFDTIRDYVDQADGQVRYDGQQFATEADAVVLEQARADATAKAGDALTAAKGYADGLALVSPQQVADGDAATLASARDYTTAKASDTLSAAQLAAQDADGDTLASAKDYADGQIDTALDGIFVGVDGKVGAGVAEAATYTDNAVAGALTTVSGTYATKAYTDQQDTASKAYTDTRETAIRNSLTSGDNAAVTSAKAYTDTRETSIRSAIPADSGWVDLTSVIGGAFVGSSNVAYRQVGKRVTLRGQIARANAANIGTETGLVTLPASVRPSQASAGVGVGSGTIFSKLIVQSSGSVDCTTPTAATTYIRLDGISFYID